MQRYPTRGPGVPANDAARYQAGLAAFESGRYEDAIELLSSIRDERGLAGTLGRFYLGQAHLQLGVREMKAGQYAAAARNLTAARRINPNARGLADYLTRCYAALRRFDLVSEECDRPQTAGEADGSMVIRLAHAQARDGRVEQAIYTLETEARSAPWRADVRVQLGLLLAARDDYAAAEAAFREAVALAPLDVGARVSHAMTLGALNRPRDAADALTMAQRLRPNDAHLGLLLTLALDAAGIRSCPEAAEPRVSAAAFAEDPAIESLGRIVEQDPDFVEAFLALPESHVDADVFALLALILERALERRPEYADLHHHCSRVYQRLGRTDDAVAEARRAIEINPRYVQALIQLARLYRQTDRTADAIDRLEAAVACGGDYADVHLMLGELHRDAGDVGRARTEYESALALNGRYVRARDALNELATRST